MASLIETWNTVRVLLPHFSCYREFLILPAPFPPLVVAALLFVLLVVPGILLDSPKKKLSLL